MPAQSASSGPTVGTLPPARPPGSGPNLGVILGAVAIVLALIAMALSFIVPGPTTTSTSPSAAPSVDLFAVVDPYGNLVRGSGVNTTTQLGVGVYEVDFYPILYGCSYSVDLGSTSYGNGPNGTVAVTHEKGNPWALNVTTFNVSGGPSNQGFHLGVVCPGGLNAEVLANGTFVSGAQVVTTMQYAKGDYIVVFNQDVSSCAYVAGLGAGSAKAPAGTAAVASRVSNPDGVWINTYDTAGALVNASFHLTVYC